MYQPISIYQIYYKDDLKQFLDKGFIPLDNSDSPRPELREWYAWNKHYKTLSDSSKYLGFFSWKFYQKTNLTSKQVFEFITSNPDYDVYLFNPCLLNEACFISSWEQGDVHHPNLSNIGNTFLSKIGYKNIDVTKLNIDNTTSIFSNFIVATVDFWESFMRFTQKIFTEADKDEKFMTSVFAEGLSNYNYDKSLPNFTFLIERLVPTFLLLNNFKYKAFKYNKDIVAKKYLPYFDEIEKLSSLKVLLNIYQNKELYDIWNFYRIKFLSAYPGILNIE
jgi:hypothetical protein